MDLLSNIPVWVYYAVLAITFMTTHVLAFRPDTAPRRPATSTAMRIGSSVVLLIGLLIIRPSDPGSVLLALLAAAVGGFLSGRAAPAPRPLPPKPGDEAGGSDEDAA